MSLLKENILDPSRETLNVNLWDNNKLKPEVRRQILNALYYKMYGFLDKENIQNIYFTGSNCSYNYNDYTDCDIHIKTNLSEEENNALFEHAPQNELVTGTTAPLTFFFYNFNEDNKKGQGAVYDVIADKWVVQPVKSNFEIPYSYAVEIAKIFMSGIDNRIMEYESDVEELQHYKNKLLSIKNEDKELLNKKMEMKQNEIMADLDALKSMSDLLYTYRSNSYNDDTKEQYLIKDETGNFSIETTVYKILEKSKYLDKLRKYKIIRKGYKIS